jgi:hypothetical protein
MPERKYQFIDYSDVYDELFGRTPNGTANPEQQVTTRQAASDHATGKSDEGVRAALRIAIFRIAQTVAVLASVVFVIVGVIRGSYAWWAIGAIAAIALVAWALKHYHLRRLALLERY